MLTWEIGQKLPLEQWASSAKQTQSALTVFIPGIEIPNIEIILRYNEKTTRRMGWAALRKKTFKLKLTQLKSLSDFWVKLTSSTVEKQ